MVTINFKAFGGKIKSSKKKKEENSEKLTFLKKESLLTKNFFLSLNKAVWMSHEDAVVKVPKNFEIVAYTRNSRLTIIENSNLKIYGVQFHPEVTHTDNGNQLFKNFLFSICKIKKNGILLPKKKTYTRSKKRNCKK